MNGFIGEPISAGRYVWADGRQFNGDWIENQMYQTQVTTESASKSTVLSCAVAVLQHQAWVWHHEVARWPDI